MDDFSYVLLSDLVQPRIEKFMPFYTLHLGQGQLRRDTSWFCNDILLLLSRLGGLFTSGFGIAAFIINGYQRFVK